MTDCYIVNLSHNHRTDKYISVWRPNNCGYAWPLSWAGRYPRDLVMRNLHYYNTGTANIAVPCEVLDVLKEDPDPGDILAEGDPGPVVRHTRENWKKIIAACVAKPPYPPDPVFKGSRKRDWEL